jgi:hypothetical protein
VLSLGWIAWEASSRAGAWLGRFGPARPLARVLPFLLVIVLTVAAVPQVTAGIDLVLRHKEDARTQGYYPADPIYLWFRDEISSPVVVLAQDVPSARIPAYSSEANVLSRRGDLVLQVLPQLEKRVPGQIEAPQGALDIQEFFNGADLQRRVEILRHHQVDYVMVEASSQLNGTLDELPGFDSLKEPSKRYNVYAVHLRTIDRMSNISDEDRLQPQ